MMKEEIVPGLEPFVQEFYKDRVEELSTLSSFLENSDFQGIAKLAHQWKSFCEPYGFGMLGKMAKGLEEVAQSQDHDACLSYVNDMRDYLDHKKQLL